MLKEKFMQMLAKKRDLSPAEAEAKMHVVNDLKNVVHESMGGRIDGLKKVAVMSNDDEGLKAGLDKAKDVVDKSDADMPSEEADESPEDEASESPEHQAMEEASGEEAHDDEFANLSPEEIDDKLAKLMALKAKMGSPE